MPEPRKYTCRCPAHAPAEPCGVATPLIDAAVARYALPLAPSLLEDEDPMPLYALKMLGTLLEVNPDWLRPLAATGVARRCARTQHRGGGQGRWD